MADVKLVCPKCEHEVSVSEYVAVQSIPCPECKTDIEVVKSAPAPVPTPTQALGRKTGTTLSGKDMTLVNTGAEAAPNIADEIRDRVLEERGKRKRKANPKMEIPKGKARLTLAIAILVSLCVVMGLNMISFASSSVTHWAMLKLDLIILVAVACVIAVMSFKEKAVIGVLLVGFPMMVYFFAVSGMHFLVAIFAIALHQLLLLQFVYYYMRSWVFKGIYTGVLASTICMAFFANTEQSVFTTVRDSYYAVEKGDLQRTAAKITHR